MFQLARNTLRKATQLYNRENAGLNIKERSLLRDLEKVVLPNVRRKFGEYDWEENYCCNKLRAIRKWKEAAESFVWNYGELRNLKDTTRRFLNFPGLNDADYVPDPPITWSDWPVYDEWIEE